VYAAKAENRGGIAKCSANLVLEGETGVEHVVCFQMILIAKIFATAQPKSGAAPTFVKTIQPVSGVSAGQLIRLDAKISGNPPIDVKWYRDGEEVQPDITHKIIQENDVYTLLILEASAIDRGVYDCVAISSAGEARCRTSVDIKPANGRRRSSGSSQISPPKVQEPLQSLTASEGQSVSFRTRVSEVSSKYRTT
jgi:hypothetical protein